MFLHSAFIEKNTPELRKYLEDLGYNPIKHFPIDSKCIFTTVNDKFPLYGSCLYCLRSLYTLQENGRIDCGDNEELFKATVAMRDDSDYMQLFVCDIDENDWFLCKIAQIEDYWVGEAPKDDLFLSEGEKDGFYHCPYHKATLEELKEHFKNK